MNTWSRRDAIRTGVGAAVGLWSASAAAPTRAHATPTILRTTRVTPASERLALGFIGMGIQNRYHLDRMLGRDDVQVVAICDVDTTRREHCVKKTNEHYAKQSPSGSASGGAGCASHVWHKELLARTDIDAVVIATPDHWHAIQILDAVKAGKDVYCEKPLTLTIHEAKAVIDAARAHKRVFQTGSQQRTEFGGVFRKACEYVRNARLGKIFTVHVGVGESSVWCDLPEEPMEPGLEWDAWLGPAPARPYNSILSPRGINDFYPKWRLYREYSGGMMTDFGAHHYDIAQWALNMDTSGPVSVRPPADANAMYGARFVYPNAVEMVHGGPFGITFVGEKGTLHVDRDQCHTWPPKILEEPLGDSDERLPAPADHFSDWIDCIRSRRAPVCNEEVGARSVSICHLANLVYWHRRALTWDPQKWEFPGDAQANSWRDYSRRPGYELPTV